MITHKDVEYFLLSNNWVKALDHYREIDKYVSLSPDIEYPILLCNEVSNRMYKRFLYQAIKSYSTFTKIDEFDCLQSILGQWKVLSTYQDAPPPNEDFYMLIRSNNQVTTFKAYDGCWNSMEGYEFNPLKHIILSHSVYRLINKK
jgi:hypothetical protein